MSTPQKDNEFATSVEQKTDLLLYGACMDSKENIHKYTYLCGYLPTLDYTAKCYVDGADNFCNYARATHYLDAWNTISYQCGEKMGYEITYLTGIKPVWKDFKNIFLDYEDSNVVINLMKCPFKILTFGVSAGITLPFAVATSAIGSTCVISTQTLYVVAQPPICFAYDVTWGTSALLLGTAYQTLAAPLIIPFTPAPSPQDMTTHFTRTIPGKPKMNSNIHEQRQSYETLRQENVKAIEIFQKSIIGLKSNHFNQMSQHQTFTLAAKTYCENATLPPIPSDLKILSLAGFTPPQLAAICDYLAHRFNP